MKKDRGVLQYPPTMLEGWCSTALMPGAYCSTAARYYCTAVPCAPSFVALLA